jgi:hypothetical protein
LGVGREVERILPVGRVVHPMGERIGRIEV